MSKKRGNPNWIKGGASPNPQGRAIVREDALPPDTVGHREPVTSGTRTMRLDGWYNVLTGFGTDEYDKAQGTTFTPTLITWQLARHLWQSDDLGARIVEIRPKEMTREGWEVCIPEDDETEDDLDEDTELTEDADDEPVDASKAKGQELAELAMAHHDRLGVLEAFYRALCFRNAYGGAAILLGVTDGAEDWSKPLDEENVKTFDWLTVLEPQELTPVEYYADPKQAKFGEPCIYMLTPMMQGSTAMVGAGSVRIHESRLVIFQGPKVSRFEINTVNPGWGDSVFVRVFRVLRDFNTSWGAAATLVAEFAPAVMKVKGLHKIIEQDHRELFAARMRAVALSKSTARAVLIDSEEDYQRQTTPVSGLPELLELFKSRLAAAAGYPVAMLFGESPGGINASGASSDQVRMFYDQVASDQNLELTKPLRRIFALIFRVLVGEVPANYSIDFHPLWQLTQAEEMERRKTQMEIDCQYIDRMVYTSEETRNARFAGDKYSTDMRVKDSAKSATAEPTAADFEAYAMGAGAPVDPNAPVDPAAPTGGVGATAADPNAPAPGDTGAAGANVQQQALNGAQVSSLIEVVTAAVSKTIPRESAAAIMELAFQVTPEMSQRLLGPDTFVPAAPPTPAPGPVPTKPDPTAPPKPADKPEAAPKPEV